MGKWLTLLIFACTLVLPAMPVAAQDSTDTGSRVIINQIKTDGAGSSHEFISLFNTSDLAIDLTGWDIEYVEGSYGMDMGLCGVSDWSTVSKHAVALGGNTIEPRGSLIVHIGSMLDDKPGALRLTQIRENQSRLIHDIVGWGTTANQPYCAESEPARIPGNKELISRCADDVGMYVDTDNNARDFVIIDEVTGATSACPDEHAEEEDNQDPQDTELEPACEDIVISEILPNPKGDDHGNEFIEIHNPTDKVISLKGCAIGLDKVNSTLFAFPENDILPAKEYRAYYDGQTGLRLTNSTSDKILLINGQLETVYTYPAGLKDDISWANINGEWQPTNNPTPGAANMPNAVIAEKSDGDVEVTAPCPAGKFRNPATNRCKNIETPKVLASCGEGEQRNPETNRCRSIFSTLATLTPCKPGQERNPATNRCRSVLVAGSSLTPCKPGQERNPDTNRCRKIASTSTELKPCPEGQERSAETNRCRKVQATLASATGLDDKKSDKKNLINYGLLGLVGVTAIGYGAYEYRHDFRYKISALRTRFFPKDGGK